MIGASGARSAPVGIADQRQAFAALMRNAGLPLCGEATDLTLPGPAGPLPTRIYHPADRAGPRPGLVFFHGGGLVAGDLDTHDGICSRLAEAAGCRVVSVAYRLAPEHPFPAAVEDAWASAAAVFDRAAALGLDPERLAVGGDSVGANLAASACQHLVQTGRQPRAQLLICPVLDGRRTGQSHRLFAEGYFVDAATLDRELAAYRGAASLDLDDPRVSPLMAPDLSGLPMAVIETAEYDIVRDDGTAYADRLRQAGVPVHATCHPGMIHLFYGFGRVIPYGAEALTAMGRRLAGALG